MYKGALLNMFNAIIVDDEKPALDVLKLLLEKTGQICVVGSFMSAADALSQLQSLKPDVAFLDIEMSEMSGLELAGKIIEADGDIEIVFVTAYDKYALEAFRVNAIDYILKPFSSDDIAQAITRLKKVKPLPVVSQMPVDKGRIYCLGRLSVYGAGCREAVKWRTSKTEELFAAEFEAITDAEIAFSAASIEKYKKALKLYKGNYLEENGYTWSQNKAEEYSQRYRGLVSELAKYYTTKTDYTNAEKILQKALTKAPLDDDLNEMLLKLFFMKKDNASLVMHYNKIKELYEAELGIAPNATLQDLFNRTFEL